MLKYRQIKKQKYYSMKTNIIKMPKLRIKPAKKHDLKNIMKLFSNVGYNVPGKKRIQRWIDKGKIYVLKDNKKVRGAFAYSVIGVLGLFSLMYIHKISIDPLLQGRGLGSLVLTKIKLRSIKIGATALILFSLKSVVSFYKKNKLNKIFWRYFWWRNKEKV